jgi:hypothetical protein
MPITIDAFTNAGYKVEELATEVWLIEDFVDNDDINSVFDYVATKTDQDWLNHYMDHLRDRAERDFGTRDIEKLNEEGKFEITFDWADKTIMLDRKSVV